MLKKIWPKKIWKNFFPYKRGFSTGINIQKNFLNFFIEFLGDFVSWYLTRKNRFFLQIFEINLLKLIFHI
jgi:hypothetical protein